MKVVKKIICYLAINYLMLSFLFFILEFMRMYSSVGFKRFFSRLFESFYIWIKYLYMGIDRFWFYNQIYMDIFFYSVYIVPILVLFVCIIYYRKEIYNWFRAIKQNSKSNRIANLERELEELKKKS